jgi:hypothetical protein
VIVMPKPSRLAAALALLVASGCAINPPPRTTSLQMSGAPRDASVTVDDQYLGALIYVAAHGVALPPGKHRITVEKAGYFPWDKLVEAHDGDPPLKLDVALTKIPD